LCFCTASAHSNVRWRQESRGSGRGGLSRDRVRKRGFRSFPDKRRPPTTTPATAHARDRPPGSLGVSVRCWLDLQWAARSPPRSRSVSAAACGAGPGGLGRAGRRDPSCCRVAGGGPCSDRWYSRSVAGASRPAAQGHLLRRDQGDRGRRGSVYAPVRQPAYGRSAAGVLRQFQIRRPGGTARQILAPTVVLVGSRAPSPAEPTRTSPRTRCGYLIATSAAIAPPMECPPARHRRHQASPGGDREVSVRGGCRRGPAACRKDRSTVVERIARKPAPARPRDSCARRTSGAEAVQKHNRRPRPRRCSGSSFLPTWSSGRVNESRRETAGPQVRRALGSRRGPARSRSSRVTRAPGCTRGPERQRPDGAPHPRAVSPLPATTRLERRQISSTVGESPDTVPLRMGVASGGASPRLAAGAPRAPWLAPGGQCRAEQLADSTPSTRRSARATTRMIRLATARAPVTVRVSGSEGLAASRKGRLSVEGFACCRSWAMSAAGSVAR